MKACMLMLLLVFAGVASLAQTLDAGGGVTVLKYSWERETIRRKASMAAMASVEELVQQSQRERQLAAARNTNDRLVATRIERENEMRDQAAVKANQGQSIEGYRYRLTLRNDSSKTIKSIDWDYVFIDQAGQLLVARHQFTSDETVKPGKTKEIYVLYLTPPVRTVSAERLASKEPLPYTEHIVIARLVYSDGSIWQHP
jgi:hypothetical protein